MKVDTILTDNWLHLDEFSWWFEALCCDDITAVSEAFRTEDKIDRLLGGFFKHSAASRQKDTLIECPASVAVCHGAFNVLYLMKSKVDKLNFTDSRGHNVIHDLITLAKENPADEETLIGYYEKLCVMLSEEELKSLLLASSDLLPLETACFYETMGMANAILQTRGVYLVKEEFVGLTSIKWYDCDHYQTLNGRNGRRKSFHPLYIISRMSKKAVSHPYTEKLLFSDPIRTWTAALGQASRLPIIFWLGFRMSFYICFTIFDYRMGDILQMAALNRFDISSDADCYPNSVLIEGNSQNTYMYSLMGYSMGCCGFVIIFDIVDFVRSSCTKRELGIGPFQSHFRMAANSALFRAFHFFMALTMLTGLCLLYVYRIDLESGSGSVNILMILTSNFSRLGTALLVIWSMMYFMQLLPGIGIFVISIQHMLKDMTSFMFIFVLFLLQFSHAFMVFMKASGQPPCFDEFTDYISSFYTMFLAIINMIDFRGFDVGSSQSILNFMHTVFVFVIPILLVNFLIGLFSTTIAEIHSYQKVFIAVERIAIWQTVHARISALCPPLQKTLMRLSNRDSFEEVNGRVCIKCVKIADNLNSIQRNRKEKRVDAVC